MYWIARAVVAALFATTLSSSMAQAYPDRLIKIVCNLAAGGVSDTVARAVAEQLSRSLGVPVIIENKPGAGGTLGAEAVVRSVADGYTLLFNGGDGLDLIPSRHLPFDAAKELVPIGAVGKIDIIVVAAPHLQVNNIKDLVTLAKAHPGKLTYASTGIGTINHMGGELLKLRAGVDILHVPYRSSAAAITDMLSGRIDLLLTALPAVRSHMQAGTLKVLASFGEVRIESTPDLPTMIESGYPDFLVSGWLGALAPAGTPPDIVQLLSRTLFEAASRPEFAAQLQKIGAQKGNVPAEGYGRWLATERQRWREVVKEGNIKLGE